MNNQHMTMFQDKVYENKDNMNVLAKLTEKCGPDSTIPQVMAMDALFAGKLLDICIFITFL